MTTEPQPWDYHSGVSECETCGGTGEVVKFPRGAYRLNPLEWSEICEDCLGEGIHACKVCGFDDVVKGHDCIVCETVHDMTPAQMRSINPADLAEHFAQAFNVALNHEECAV